MIRPHRAIVAILVSCSLLATVGCSSSDDPRSEGSGPAPTDVDDSVTDKSAQPTDQIAEQLAETPVEASPVHDPAVSAAQLIPAATGGSVQLTLRDTSTATLSIPAGALAADTTIVLIEVNALGSNGQRITGVDVLPEGLLFAPELAPSLTLSAPTAADFAVAWDADGKLERSLVIDNDDGSVTIPMFHFSGAGTGGGASPLPTSEVDRVIDDVRQRVRDALATGDNAQVDAAISTSLDELQQLAKGYQRSALKAAADQCHALGPVKDQLRIGSLASVLGGEVDNNATEVGAVLVKSADCALAECTSGDRGAAARFVHAAAMIDAGLGEVAPAKEAELNESITNGQLLDCATFDVTISGHATYELQFSLEEGFHAHGAVAAGQTDGALPLTASVSGWEHVTAENMSLLIADLASLFGAAGPDVTCQPPDYPVGAMTAIITTAPGVDPNSQLPVLEFHPYMPTTPLDCGLDPKIKLEALDPISMAVLLFAPGIQSDGRTTRHYFIESEQIGPMSWSTIIEVDLAPYGAPGSATVVMQVRTTSDTPTSGTSPLGMNDMYRVFYE